MAGPSQALPSRRSWPFPPDCSCRPASIVGSGFPPAPSDHREEQSCKGTSVTNNTIHIRYNIMQHPTVECATKQYNAVTLPTCSIRYPNRKSVQQAYRAFAAFVSRGKTCSCWESMRLGTRVSRQMTATGEAPNRNGEISTVNAIESWLASAKVRLISAPFTMVPESSGESSRLRLARLESSLCCKRTSRCVAGHANQVQALNPRVLNPSAFATAQCPCPSLSPFPLWATGSSRITDKSSGASGAALLRASLLYVSQQYNACHEGKQPQYTETCLQN